MNWLIFTLFFGLLYNECRGLTNTTKDDIKAIKLPPCAACKVLTKSFEQGMDRTSRGKFEGGDAAWEEEKMKTYKTSEVRLVEIQEMLCSEVERGQTQCHANGEQHDHLIEDWWIKFQDSRPDLYDWLCIEKLEVCCPENHFGPNCLPCKGGTENPCRGSGRCKGAGTRKGNGQCDCNAGHEGDVCDKCSTGHFESYKDEEKLLCEPCHKACQGHCSQAGPKSCAICKAGWIMDTDIGCLDINECVADVSPCKDNEFCLNNEGSFVCIKCDKSCDGCSGDGPDMCYSCADGFNLEDDMCVDIGGRKREEHLTYARYVTYLGLTIATCIILQRHTIMAAVVGLFVAGYISFSEYYLTHLQSDVARRNPQVPLDVGSASPFRK